MSKVVVVALDGTWNKPEPLERGELFGSVPTNVYLLWLAMGGPPLHEVTSSACETLEHSEKLALIYVRGVGSGGSSVAKAYQGATGSGTSLRIKNAYRLISQVYREGDQIYVFGFSRGAFAARSLCGMLNRCGMSASDLTKDQVDVAYDQYRRGGRHGNPVPVAYLGLWDTVAAISLPQSLTSFHDDDLANVRQVRHALALDEMRSRFIPSYWPTPQSNVLQTWFAGAHSNIGGGYPNPNLANIAYFWILAGAKRAGLPIEFRNLRGLNTETAGEGIRDSYGEFWEKAKGVGELVRNAVWGEKAARFVAGQDTFHVSVLEAMQAGYKPNAKLDGNHPITVDRISDRTVPWEVNDDGTLV